jgi:hypothetical protein
MEWLCYAITLQFWQFMLVVFLGNLLYDIVKSTVVHLRKKGQNNAARTDV